ncbi:hypothetical protein KY317_02530 [Candidatus Woesearchaeota archaeon]|nr:hypothetical protein [Candidatus Woesearchaeota archaeon]
MKRFVIIIILITIMSIFLAGCIEKELLDKKEPEITEPPVTEIPAVPVVFETPEDLISTFIDLWGSGRHEEMHALFASHLREKLPAKKFAYLFGREFSYFKSIKQVYYDVRDSTAKFSVMVRFYDGTSKRVSLIEAAEGTDGWHIIGLTHYFNPLDYCSTEHNKGTCMYAYANKFNEVEWCNHAETLFKGCYDSLGVDLTVDEIKEICAIYTKSVSSQAECYKVLAYAEDNSYYCSTIQMAKKRYECYGGVAAKHDDITECEPIRDAESFGEKQTAYSYCVAGYVEITGDASMCDEIIVSDIYSEQGKKVCLGYGR